MNMSAESWRRFGIRMWKLMRPASVFETVMLVMSGAALSSPVASLYVFEFAAVREGALEPAPAVAGMPRSPASTRVRRTPRARILHEATDRVLARQEHV